MIQRPTVTHRAAVTQRANAMQTRFGPLSALLSYRPVVALAVLALLAPVHDADAQVRRGRATAPPVDPWAPVAIGVHFGWDNQANGEVIGGQVRIPVLRNGVIELVPNASMVFLQSAKDYQYGVDLAFVPGGRAGGLFLIGGLAWRDTPLASIDSRSTFFGWVAGVGGKTALGPVELEAAIKWVFLNDTQYRPNFVTLGVNYPLWRVPRPGS